VKKGETLGPIPDGLIRTEEKIVAIEAEISAKKPADVVAKLARLARKVVFDDEESYGYRKAFDEIWVYVPNERMEKLVESALGDLRDEDAKRIGVAVIKDLVAV
jgi:hypothetical protein